MPKIDGSGTLESGTTQARYACKAFACAIQECLVARDYQQRACVRQISELMECCKSLAEPSVHCQGFGFGGGGGPAQGQGQGSDVK